MEPDLFDSPKMGDFVEIAPSDLLVYIYTLATKDNISKKVVEAKYKHAMDNLTKINHILDDMIKTGHDHIMNYENPDDFVHDSIILRHIDMSGTWYAVSIANQIQRRKERMDATLNYDDLIEEHQKISKWYVTELKLKS
ncbi:hypothetical protein EhV18_00361 [Emiliania huxleyi virus 18]|nr:hypothetical protein EhV18_00361 [Emiliania huxleyi virus 18]AHA55449.1 hypothetical protein EhV156_00354 [Emiliania huxleyi virus 156]